MLQIKNTLGGGKPEGLYVWKKSSYSPAVSLKNPTFDYISATVSSSSSDYTFGNFSFDISIIDDWTKFFTGFVNTNGYGSNFPSDGIFHNYSDNGNWNYTVSEVNLSAGTVTIHIGGQCGDYKSEGTYKYTGTKVVSEEIKEFLDYIVSDKETAYPDGGEKGGYWYERVVEGAKFTTGTVTPSSDMWLRVEHGLGVTPDIITVMAESSNTSILAYALHDIKRPDYALIGNLSGTTKVVTMYRDNTSYDKSSSYGCCNETFFSLPYYQYSTSWGTSLVYRWVCISLKE